MNPCADALATLGRVFDLYQAIITVLRTTNETDPTKIIRQVTPLIPEDDRLEIINVLGRRLVTEAMHRERDVAPKKEPESLPSYEENGRRYAKRISGRPALRQRLIGADGQWKMLGDFTVEDFRTAADRNRAMIEGNERGLERNERRAELMEQHHVLKFADLPIEVLESELGP